MISISILKHFFVQFGSDFDIFYFVTNLVLVSFVCFFFEFFFVFDSSRLPFALLPCLPVQNRENLLFLSTMIFDFPRPHFLVVLLPIWFRLMGLCCISQTMDFQYILFHFVCFLHGFLAQGVYRFLPRFLKNLSATVTRFSTRRAPENEILEARASYHLVGWPSVR